MKCLKIAAIVQTLDYPGKCSLEKGLKTSPWIVKIWCYLKEN